ncbi:MULTISPECIES: hypothetical protein [Legionella]|uniref:Uncharacterized protein n=1 Tax=Legionella steelei TaxID=947033 RepID=A0A0W0ZC47_9GAMM|nr:MULTISPECIES: hypothetical protein [Legionella]KTD66786.1 hypothetical protein Lste_2992 [Legionella steelei]MBN9226114.1 hypothetical protein [Legionella steelei]OJW16658.1 MAG: hypothetical protein BGO44_01105 [Legionella sp. 39-23]
MDDPFSDLKKALDPLFYLVPNRDGKYGAFSEIQRLKEAVENYLPKDKGSFIALIKALGAAVPQFEKWRVNFDSIKRAADSLAEQHKMPYPNWDKFLSGTSMFQFSTLNMQEDHELIDWLTAVSGEAFPHDEINKQTSMLIDHSEQLGFSPRLRAHLEKDPKFLSRLIMKSKENFNEILNTRLSFHLTDKQIAKAIVHHYLPPSIQKDHFSFAQVEQFIQRFNEILSNSGRSVPILLRNAAAKDVLDKVNIFQIYQSDEYQNRQESPSFANDEPLSPQQPNKPW